MREFSDLATDDQVAVLTGVATKAAQSFGLDATSIDLVEHGYNATFKVVDQTGTPRALRVQVNSVADAATVAAHVAWTAALAGEAGVVVPRPIATPDGRFQVAVTADGWPQPWLCVLNSWLEGDNVGGDIDDIVVCELGRTMARLHDHAEGWTLPPGTALPTFDHPLFGDDDEVSHLTDEPEITAALHRCAAAFRRVFAGQQPIAVHADLHGFNLKWHEGRLAVFDFDDAGLGVPALDLAVAVFYLRGHDPSIEDALGAGYRELRPWPDVDPDDFEALVASRQLLLLNLLLHARTADLRAGAAEYLVTSRGRLGRWLETGRFRLA